MLFCKIESKIKKEAESQQNKNTNWTFNDVLIRVLDFARETFPFLKRKSLQRFPIPKSNTNPKEILI